MIGDLDRPQVEGAALGPFSVAVREVVADEQVLDDPFDLLPAHQEEAAPPALEFEEALRLGVDLREEVVVLVEVGVGGVERLEVLDQVGAVERAGAEIAGQERGPDAAEHAARITHRVLAIVAGPVGHRRPIDHDGTDEVRFERADEHGGPAALAVADHDRLARLRMALADNAEEFRLGARDIREGLPRHRFGKKDHEVDRVPCLERHPDLRVLLEPADAGPVAGPRIDDDEGPALRVGLDAIRRRDLHEGIVRGLLERAGIGNHLPVEIQERRLAGLLMFEPVVAALAQGVPEQDGALREVEPVVAGVPPEVQRRRRADRPVGQRFTRGLRRIEVTLPRVCAPLPIDFGQLCLRTSDLHESRLSPILASLSSRPDLLHYVIHPR